MEFRCNDCNLNFESDGTRLEYRDPIYGPCSRMIANCPQCGQECSEFRKPKQARSASKATEGPAASCPAYHSGSCGCCH